MAKKGHHPPASTNPPSPVPRAGKPSALLDTRVVYCGDNLEQLQKLPDGCVDLIYIDPPFNSNRNYEVFWGETKEKRAFEDRHASTQAYIDYMRPRCVQLARVLKKTGSFYYHCDWHASHYVKVMLDVIFGENNFQNEIIWKRTSSHNDPGVYGRIHDTIFFYTGGDKHTFNVQYGPYDPDYIKAEFRPDETGELVKYENLTGAGISKGSSGLGWRGVDPTKSGRHWAVPTHMLEKHGIDGDDLTTQEKLERLLEVGRIKVNDAGVPLMRGLKTYLKDLPGMPLQSLWADIPKVGNTAKERLGYPTQKPLALLDRIIKTSSNPNDIVLDAFCGCGTALVAAQNLGRQWIGIDISPTACRVMAKRLRDVCNMKESEPLWKAHRDNAFVVRDLPWTVEKLRALPHFEFENWAVIALGGIPNKVQVGDMGVDGRIFPVGTKPSADGLFSDDWFPIQVKQVDKVGRPDIDAFQAVMEREGEGGRQRGFFVSFGYTKDAEQECAAFHKRTGRIIKLLTVQEILDEAHLQKM
jgi:DNA modification methylase